MKRRAFLAAAGIALAGRTEVAAAAVDSRLGRLSTSGDICGLAFQTYDGNASAAQTVTFAHPFPAGQVWPGRAFRILGRPAQLDVSTTYPDGSVRHALVAAMVPALRQGEVRSATLSMQSAIVAAADAAPPLACNIVVTFEPRGGGGQPVAVDVGEAFRSGSVESWRKGPLVSEGRVRIPVPSLSGDFELVCDLACFNDGTPKRADLNFCREKVQVVDHQSETPVPNVAYGVTVADGGKPIYQADIPIHALAQIWHYTIGENQMHVVFDIHALRASGTVIHDPSLGVKEGTVNSFRIQQQGPLQVVKEGSIATVRDIVQYMGMTGGRTDIGPQTTPVACWLITQQAGIAQYCLWQADGASAIPWHFRDEKTGSYIFVSDYPNLWVGWSGAQGPGLSTNNGWGIDFSHQPDCSYVPWLLTGRRKFLDDLMAQGTESVNWYNPDYRQRGKGMICQYPNAPYQQQVRGQAWSLRQICQAAALAPDKERLKGPMTTVVNANLAGLLDVSKVIGEGELNFWISARPATWEQDYMATSLAAADALGYPDALPVLKAMMGFLAGSMLSPDFYPKDCCAYELPIDPRIVTWKAARDAFVASKDQNRSGMGTSWAGNTFKAYYAARRGTLSYAAHKGDPKAQQALKWFLANVGDGPSAGATDDGWRADPTFAIG